MQCGQCWDRATVSGEGTWTQLGGDAGPGYAGQVPLIYSGLPLLADFIVLGQVHLLERRKKFTSKKAVFIGLESVTLMVRSLLSGWSTPTPYILQRWQPSLRLWAPKVVLTFY